MVGDLLARSFALPILFTLMRLGDGPSLGYSLAYRVEAVLGLPRKGCHL